MKNASPKIVSKPGGKVGGTNKSVSPVKSPSKYTGGKNSDVKVKPSK